MQIQLKRQYYVTATKYLELVSSYRYILHEKRTKISGQIFALRNGLSTLAKSRDEISNMQVCERERECVCVCGVIYVFVVCVGCVCGMNELGSS